MKFLAPWSDKAYWRRLIVRAIEDACFMLFLVVMICWSAPWPAASSGPWASHKKENALIRRYPD